MRLLLASAIMVVTALLIVLGALMKKAAEVVIEEEYDTWAPKVARGLVGVAGYVCRSSRDRWRADLEYLQKVEKKTGLVEAASCFMSCWFVALTHATNRARSVVRQKPAIEIAILAWSNTFGLGYAVATVVSPAAAMRVLVAIGVPLLFGTTALVVVTHRRTKRAAAP